jgi:hypothetical protein
LSRQRLSLIATIAGLPPEARRGEIGAFTQRAKLRPNGVFGDEFVARKSAEAAINAGNNPTPDRKLKCASWIFQ